MNYKRVIDRIFTNLHINDENSKDLRIVRNDIEDTLVDVFGRSEYPKKEVSFTIAETEDIVVNNFSNLPDNVTLTDVNADGTIDATDFGIIEVYPLKIINTCSFTVTGTFGAIATIGTVKVLDENDTELFSDTFTQTSYPDPETFTFPIGASGVNLKLQIVVKAPADMADCAIINFTYNVDDFTQRMPDDFFLPMEVKFDGTTGKKRYVSKEMTPEQYMLWTPFKFTTDSDEVTEVTAVDEELSTYQFTEENLDYDWKIGYYFQVTPDGIYLHWKPKFAGTITLYYSYLPTLTISDASTAQVHRTYVNMLVNGTTCRWLRRDFTKKDPQRNEIEFAGLRTAYSEYKVEFDRDLAVFAGWVDQRSTPAMILPFNFLNDSFMELE